MRGQRKGLTRRQEIAITALLQHGTVSKAAVASSVPESTLWRWMQEKEFSLAYRVARRTLTERSTALLQQASTSASAKLINLIDDPNVPPYVQLTAARTVLEFSYRGQEIEDIEARISALEETLAEPETPKGLRAV